jgi:hypothetical protein
VLIRRWCVSSSRQLHASIEPAIGPSYRNWGAARQGLCLIFAVMHDMSGFCREGRFK